MKRATVVAAVILLLIVTPVRAQSPFSGSLVETSSAAGPLVRQPGGGRTLSESILTQQNELLPGVTVTARSGSGEARTTSDAGGHFRLAMPPGPLTARFEGRNVTPVELSIGPGGPTEGLRVRVELLIPPVHESVVIQGTALDPSIDRRNDEARVSRALVGLGVDLEGLVTRKELQGGVATRWNIFAGRMRPRSPEDGSTVVNVGFENGVLDPPRRLCYIARSPGSYV